MKQQAPKIDIQRIYDLLHSLNKKVDMVMGRVMATPALMVSAQKPPVQHNNPNANRDRKPNEFRKEKITFQAVCADCKKPCTVPFKPSADRAVYCQECFAIRKQTNNFKPNVENKPQPAPSIPEVKEEKKPAPAKPKKKPAAAKKTPAKKKSPVKKKKTGT